MSRVVPRISSWLGADGSVSGLTVDGAAVALSGSVLLGAANRWLAGGTDLFVEAA